MTDRRLKVLILGGYGTFGGRLALLLASAPALTLIIAGRSLAKADAFAATLPRGATLRTLALDRTAGLAEALGRETPDILVDATGPFQAYGTDPYAVVRAAIAAGVNYLDLADAADFVAGVGQFDEMARAAGVFVLSGVSSFPVLTAAVVRALGADLAGIEGVSGGIAPSPYAGVGLNVIRAITGYAGQEIGLVRDGVVSSAFALTETRRYTIAPPGRIPLRNTRFSLVEVPDLLLIPRAVPSIRTMWMGAGPVPEILHRALNLLAWSVRLKLLASIAALAPLCSWAINSLRWGEHRGGMFVEIAGKTVDGRAALRSWHMIAEGDDGPLIPSMAVAIIVMKMLEATVPAAGARPATEALELKDYEDAFAGRAIFSGRRDDECQADQPLYRQLLGASWNDIPSSLQTMHDGTESRVAAGLARVEGGRGLWAALVRRLIGFPPAGENVPVTVRFDRKSGIERWTRAFAHRRFSSLQSAGSGRGHRLLVERFGPISVSLALAVADNRLNLVVRRWSCFGVPLPMFLAPGGEACEFEADGRFNFHVAITHPWIGLVVGYRGWLEPQP